MKRLFTTFAAVAALSTTALAAEPTGPADKTDGGSLSSGAKEASPATKNQGENAPIGQNAGTNDGTSPGPAATDDGPAVPAEAGQSTPDTKGSPQQ